MDFVNYISPTGSTGGTGGGPEDNSRYPQIAVKQQGFLAIAFGLALGLTLIVLYLLLRIPRLPETFTLFMPTFWGNVFYSIITYFVGGVIIGSVLSIIYNLLLHKRFDMFGIEHTMD